jgi:hypothetical protein
MTNFLFLLLKPDFFWGAPAGQHKRQKAFAVPVPFFGVVFVTFLSTFFYPWGNSAL